MDTLVEVGVDTLDDVDTEDEVEAELDVDTLKTKRRISTIRQAVFCLKTKHLILNMILD